jgi:hypothetical protein
VCVCVLCVCVCRSALQLDLRVLCVCVFCVCVCVCVIHTHTHTAGHVLCNCVTKKEQVNVLLASALQFDLRESVDRCRNFIIKNGSACLLNATFEAVPEHEVCRLLDFGVYIHKYRAPSLASLVPLKPV